MKTKNRLFTPLLRITVLALCLHSPGMFAAEVQEEFHHTYPVSQQPQFRLDNVNGKVRITTWDRAEIQVNGIKRAKTKKELDATKVEIKASEAKVTVHTELPKGEWRHGTTASVEYEVKVPAQARLQSIESVNGEIEVSGVQGKVEASTVNGRLVAKDLGADTKLESVNGVLESSFKSLDRVKSASFKTVNGKMDITLPPHANAELSASTLNGRIRAEPLHVQKNWPVGSELHGKIGDGGPRIKAESVNGPIRFNLPGAVEPAVLERTE